MYRLSKDILDTVTYYDVFDYPLSAFEIWKHLLTLQEEGVRPSSYLEVYAALRHETGRGTLLEDRGFYCLSGREGLATLRIRKEKISAAKLRRIKRLARLIRLFPYVRFAGATGSLSLKHGDIGLGEVGNELLDEVALARAGRALEVACNAGVDVVDQRLLEIKKTHGW